MTRTTAPSPEFAASLRRASAITSVVLVVATQAVFATAAADVELGLLPVWVWLICTAALLLVAAVMASSVRQFATPRPWRPVWMLLAAAVLNTVAFMAWAPVLR